MASQATGRSNKAKRLLKCFCDCGCQELTEDEVKRIYQLPPQQILTNPLAKELFQKYLKYERGTCPDKSKAENNLIIYGLCEQMVTNGRTTKVAIAEIIELQFNLKKELDTNSEKGDSFLINCLKDIQQNCGKEIEASVEFKKFKEAILNKLNANK